MSAADDGAKALDRITDHTARRGSGWLVGGTTLGLIFVWMLSFPFYGPLSGPVLGKSATLVGHAFAISHAATYFLLPPLIRALRKRMEFSPSPVLAGLLVAVSGSLMVLAEPRHWQIGATVAGAAGAAYLTLAWAEGFLLREHPSLELGLAMAGCNLLLAAFPRVMNAKPDFVRPVALVLALCPMCASVLLSKSRRVEPSALSFERREITKKALALLLAFSLVEYFSGGLWYRVVIPAFYAAWPQLGGLETVLYALQVAGLAVWVRRRNYAGLGVASVSLSGLGLLWFLSGPGDAAGLIATLLLALGLATMDMFFWLAVHEIAAKAGSVVVFGWGLGASILFITLPGLTLDLGLTSGAASDPLGVIAGASLLFLAIPLVLRLNRSMTGHEPSPIASETPRGGTVAEAVTTSAALAVTRVAAGTLVPPPYLARLTAQELRVYECLRVAMTDKQIAEKLVISPNTVKYHTRRILRKAGAANRKELLANDLRDQNPVLPHPRVDLD